MPKRSYQVEEGDVLHGGEAGNFSSKTVSLET
jgi:hypothetical protein